MTLQLAKQQPREEKQTQLEEQDRRIRKIIEEDDTEDMDDLEY